MLPPARLLMAFPFLQRSVPHEGRQSWVSLHPLSFPITANAVPISYDVLSVGYASPLFRLRASHYGGTSAASLHPRLGSYAANAALP